MQNKIMDFLKFRTFMTHQIIKILFWIGTAIALLMIPVWPIFALVSDGFGTAVITFIVAIFSAFFSILVYRVMAEMVIVIFGIHDELKALNDRARDTHLP